MKYHEDFEKSKGSFTPVVTDPITERVKKNTQDFSDISYRGIQRRVVEMERKRVDQDQENLTGKQNLGFIITQVLLLYKTQADLAELFYLSSAISIQICYNLEMMFLSKSVLKIFSYSSCKSPVVCLSHSAQLYNLTLDLHFFLTFLTSPCIVEKYFGLPDVD